MNKVTNNHTFVNMHKIHQEFGFKNKPGANFQPVKRPE